MTSSRIKTSPTTDQFPWILLDSDGVVDRYETEALANQARDDEAAEPGLRVQYSPFDEGS